MPARKSNHLVVLTTLSNVDDAQAFVRSLVEKRLVACGTLLPGSSSIYRWRGEVTEASEVVVLLKTRSEQWSALQTATRDLHPYEVPELLALPVTDGLESYLRWVTAETIGPEGKE